MVSPLDSLAIVICVILEALPRLQSLGNYHQEEGPAEISIPIFQMRKLRFWRLGAEVGHIIKQRVASAAPRPPHPPTQLLPRALLRSQF